MDCYDSDKVGIMQYGSTIAVIRMIAEGHIPFKYAPEVNK